MENVRILGIEKPFVSAYKHHALPLAILTNYGDNLTWSTNNYIQIYAKDYKLDPHWLDFYIFDSLLFKSYAPWLTVQSINSGLITRISTMKDFVKSCIDNGDYVYINYDSYFIEHTNNYKKEHAPNNMLIFGYDFNTYQFDVYDYAYTSSRQLEHIKVSIKKIETAFVSNINKRWARVLSYNYDYNHKFDLELLVRSLQDYLYSRNSVETYKLFSSNDSNDIFGIGVYQKIIEFCEDAISNEIEFHILPFCLLLDHKRIMKEMVTYLCNNGLCNRYDLIPDFYQIENEILLIRNIAMKYVFKQNKNELQGIINRIVLLSTYEYNTLTKLINAII